MSESWVEVIQLDIRYISETRKFFFINFIRALNNFMVKSSEYNDEIKLIIALANETLKRNGQYTRILAKQKEAKLYYG